MGEACRTYERDVRRPRRKWKDIIRMVLRRSKMGSSGQDSSGSDLGPVVGSFENGNEPLGSMKGGEFLD